MRVNDADAQDAARTPQSSSEIVLELTGDLEITPGVATVLLRILRKAAQRQQLDIDDIDPSEPLAS